MEVAALAKHPKEVGGVEIVEGGGDETAPNLQNKHFLNNYNLNKLFLVAMFEEAPFQIQGLAAENLKSHALFHDFHVCQSFVMHVLFPSNIRAGNT